MKPKIKALMALREIKFKQIAENLGVSPVTVSVVLNGHSKSRRIQQAIADALELPIEELWAEEVKVTSQNSKYLNTLQRKNKVKDRSHK